MKTYKQEIRDITQNGIPRWVHSHGGIMRIRAKNISVDVTVANNPWTIDIAPIDKDGCWSGPMESIVLYKSHPLYDAICGMRKILECEDQIRRSKDAKKSAMFKADDARKSLAHNLKYAETLRSAISNMESRINDIRTGNDGTLGDHKFPFKID